MNRFRIALFAALVFRAGSAAAASYSITDLGQLPAAKTGTRGVAVNGSGQVVGLSGHPFLWAPGQMQDINAALPMTPLAPAMAADVNDDGVVVGWYTNTDSVVRPFRWANGVFTNLAPAATMPERAVAINNAGDVAVRGVGTSYLRRTDGTRAFLFGFTPGAPLWPSDLNDSRQVAGYALNADRAMVAALWSNGVATPLGVLPGDINSVATAINARGDIVGYSFGAVASPSNVRPFLWTGDGMTLLPPRAANESCIAVAVNAAGHAVGFVGWREDGGETAALLWRDGAVVDLQTLLPPDSGWWLRAARGINDAGQITGYGVFDNGYRAFLLTPPPPTIPGDANGDGEVTMADAAMVLDMAAGLGPIVNAALADVAPIPSDDPRGHGDGVVDARDAVMVLRIASGLG